MRLVDDAREPAKSHRISRLSRSADATQTIAMKRRPISPFSLSFLDIMFCGFGAVVLLVLILNTDMVRARNAVFADLRSDVVQLEREVITDRAQLSEIRKTLETTDAELTESQSESERISAQIRELESAIARMSRETLARREDIDRLQSDLKDLDAENKRLGNEVPDEQDDGDAIREFAGEGDRQYLTGLKVGGRRILILVDASASMLDETVVNVIRRRNMDEARKRNAPKWRRTLRAADWLVSNLPANANFQIYAFNTAATAALPSSEGRWLSTSRRQDVEGAISGLRQRIPQGGTSLHKAFAVAKALSPRPDNILLLTDGLPTQGRSRPSGTTVSGEQRLRHFLAASADLAPGIPVNTILLPMEGDAYAAAAFWRLALDTRGSLITPARDWP